MALLLFLNIPSDFKVTIASTLIIFNLKFNFISEYLEYLIYGIWLFALFTVVSAEVIVSDLFTFFKSKIFCVRTHKITVHFNSDE